MTKTLVPLLASRPRWVVLLSVLSGGALLLAACGGSPGHDAGVAQLKATTTTQGTGSHNANPRSAAGSGSGAGSGSSAGPSGGPGPGQQFAMAGGNQTQMLAFSHCMQTHGVPNFPEPNSQGVVQGSGINPSSPSFQSASKDCRHLLPNGGQPTPAQQAQALAQALKFSQCMRSHGISDFPDPQSAGGGRISISLRGGPGSDLSPQNPQFQAAQTACGGGPGGPKGGLSTHGQSKSPSGAVAG
jgi:hypothetical protein